MRSDMNRIGYCLALAMLTAGPVAAPAQVLYVTNFNANTVSKVAPGGGPGAVSSYVTGFTRPTGVAVDAAGDLFVADFTANTVSKVAPGGGAGSISLYASGFNQPAGVTIDAAGELFVVDFGTN